MLFPSLPDIPSACSSQDRPQVVDIRGAPAFDLFVSVHRQQLEIADQGFERNPAVTAQFVGTVATGVYVGYLTASAGKQGSLSGTERSISHLQT